MPWVGTKIQETMNNVNYIYSYVQLKMHGHDGYDGTYYKVDFPEKNVKNEGPIWLCPALLKFFDKSPQNIYVKIK